MKKIYKILGCPVVWKSTAQKKILKIFNIPVFEKKTSGFFWDTAEPPKPNAPIKIAVQIQGGFGDQLIACNYIKCLWDKLGGSVNIDVFCHEQIGRLFLEGQPFIQTFFPERKFNPMMEKYDVCINVRRFPNIIKYNNKRIAKNAVLCEYVALCETFKQLNMPLFDAKSWYDSLANIYSLIKGQKRINQADVHSFLKMGEFFEYSPHIPKTNILQQYNLENKKIITFHRGCDTSYTGFANKLWPTESYNELIQLIKERFPEYTLVQLGVNDVRCSVMTGIDVNLVGKTTMGDMMYILKKSLLHVDGEGGLVHLRHAIRGGKSVVFFGPTSVDFYGYSENINICSNACPHWCEHVKEKWMDGCLKTNNVPLCMTTILPSVVFNRVSEYLGAGVE